MSRSLRVHPNYIHGVKTAFKRSGCPRQQDLASDLEVSLDTVSKFLNCRPVDHSNFIKISTRLKLDWQKIADFDGISSPNENEKVEVGAIDPYLDEENTFIYVERPPIETYCYETLLTPGALVRIKAPFTNFHHRSRNLSQPPATFVAYASTAKGFGGSF